MNTTSANEIMYLIITHENMKNGTNIYSVVKTKEDAYDKANEFLRYEGLEKEMNWQELKNFDYTAVGEYGFVKIKEYCFGDDIVMEN